MLGCSLNAIFYPLQEHYLPFVLCSKLKRWCQGTRDEALVTFVTNAMQIEDRAALLEVKQNEGLANISSIADFV